MAANQHGIEPYTTRQDDDKPTDTNVETIEAVGGDRFLGARDKAGQLLKEAGHAVIVTPAENKRILRKLTWPSYPYCWSSTVYNIWIKHHWPTLQCSD